MTVFGTVRLGGTLEVDVADGYRPDPIDEFTIIMGDSVDDEFDTWISGGSFTYDIHYQGDRVVLTNFNFNFVPEPSVLVMLVGGALAWLLCSWRCRRRDVGVGPNEWVGS